MSSASSSTVSLVSNNTVSSRTPLTGPTHAQPKDFQAAFASLQSTYGFAAAAPSPVQKTAAPRSAPRSTANVSPRQAPSSGQPKDFEAAFASLQSTYGFGAAVPTPVQKTAAPRSAPRSTATVSPRQASSPGQPKDFEAAFASLQSTYGFAAAVPSPVQKPEKERSSSLFSKFTRTSSLKSHATSPSPSVAAYKAKVRQVPRPLPHMVVL